MSRIAIIGGGVAGLHAAWRLHERHDVTIFESGDRIGGHACPVDGMDTAFMIFNAHSYPLFMEWLGELGVAGNVQDADMSFGFWNMDSGLKYAVETGLSGLFGRHVWRPSFWRMIRDIVRFRKTAQVAKTSLNIVEYLRGEGYGPEFIDDFLIPMSMAIWSVPRPEVSQLPAETFLRFMDNHGYLGASPGKRWKTLRGSSAVYLDAFTKKFRGTIRTGERITKVSQLADFDRIVIATHADDALRLLDTPTDDERRLLGAWRYHSTEAALHTGDGAAASWNLRWGRAGSAITYHLNRVQNLSIAQDYFITMGDLPVDGVLRRFRFKHPIYDARAVATQSELPRLNARHYFCGSYFGFGFHEDAIASARGVLEWAG